MSSTRLHRALVGVFVAFVTTWALGCQATPAARVFVGTVADSDAFVAVVLVGGAAAGYVCDGTESSVGIAVWFEGPAAAATFDLTSSGEQLSGRLEADGVIRGTVTLGDATMHAFSASEASPPAGLYRDARSEPGAAAGWIVLADGSLRGARTGLGAPAPVRGSRVGTGTVSGSSGGRDFMAPRVSGLPLDPVTASSADAGPRVDAGSSSCSGAITCNGHGTCAGGSCTCDTGFAGPTCATCAPNFFGFPACRFCTAAATCGGRGTCDATGGCACNTGFAGATCAMCAPNFFSFPACRFCTAAATCSGRGTCDPMGNCVCNAGFSGPSCT